LPSLSSFGWTYFFDVSIDYTAATGGGDRPLQTLSPSLLSAGLVYGGTSGQKGVIPVLVLTEQATNAIQAIVSSSEVGADAGLRVTVAGEQDQPTLQLAVAEGPTESDVVVEAEGARVFLEPEAASALGDKVLDATVEGKEVRFAIGDQPEQI
jgi:Fe-S cluster assembly iron-binding protein IscA